jgi:hypothetical protein
MIDITKIKFDKAPISYIDTIFSWLAEPHMVEFWDNSQEHKDDVLNFIQQSKFTYLQLKCFPIF